MAEERKKDQVLVRMDTPLFRRLYKAARENHRSIPAHIRFLLDKHLPQRAK